MQGEKSESGTYKPFYLKEKIGDMMRYARPITMQFGRRNRDLADEIRKSMLKMYHLAVELEKKYYRKSTTQELDVELEWLRHLVRLAADKSCFGEKFAPPISEHQYEVWSRYNEEIGNLLGGYLKTLQR